MTGGNLMVKFFVTGDNHFGKKYDRYPEIKDRLIQSRFDCLRDMIKEAEYESCEFFIITGDLFDNINTIKVADVEKVVEILSGFNGNVLVLPGNHDYYTGEEKVWKDFENELLKRNHNIILLTKYETYSFDAADGKVVIYPAFCQSKHSKENNLDWIKKSDIPSNSSINIGIAHGAIKGITPDMKEEYFLMTEDELSDIAIDAWFIGHTHIPYPECLREDKETEEFRIFNAGTHEQTDLHNNTEGNGFIITIEKENGVSRVFARKYVSGKIHFYDVTLAVKPDSDTALEDALKESLLEKNKQAVVRVKLSGTIKQREYQMREQIYQTCLGDFLTYEIDDSEISEEITIEKIRSEFAETSFAAKFMEELINSPIELQMAYQLLQECKEN